MHDDIHDNIHGSYFRVCGLSRVMELESWQLCTCGYTVTPAATVTHAATATDIY